MTKEELDAIRTNVSFNDVSIHDVIPLLAEVERLTAEAATAFKRGAAAMREAAVLASRENIGCRHTVCHSCESPAAVIRALPDPEDK